MYETPFEEEILRERPIAPIPREIGQFNNAWAFFILVALIPLSIVLIYVGRWLDNKSLSGKLGNYGNKMIYVGLFIDNEHMPTSMDDNQIDISHRKEDQFDELGLMGGPIAEEVVNPNVGAKKKKGKKGKKGKKKKATASQGAFELEGQNLEGGEPEMQLEGGSDEDGPRIFDIEKARTKKRN